jgi:transcriptional regulator NrdR family protein
MTHDTWTCPECGGNVKVTDTNEAEYPEPLRETRECESCDYETTRVLTA